MPERMPVGIDLGREDGWVRLVSLFWLKEQSCKIQQVRLCRDYIGRLMENLNDKLVYEQDDWLL